MTQPSPISLTILRKGDTNIIDLAEMGVLIPRSETRVDDAFLREVSAEVGSIGLPRYGRNDHGAVVRDLQRIGELLFSHLLPEAARQRLRTAEPCDLYLRLDEQLVHLPWELCYDGEQFLANKFRLGRQVITSSPLPSSRTAHRRQGALRVLVIADPTETLPQASKEAERLCELLGAIKEVEVTLLGGRVVRRVPLLAALEAHEVVHFAGHSQYDPQTPSHSGWVLHEGILTAGELGKLSHPPLLVFSNSCQAGATAAWQGGARYEGQAFGIGSAFLLAGVKNYIGTFWVAHDEESAVFATAFYHSLTAGQSLGEALYQARQAIIAQRGWQGLTWASYMLYGDPAFTLLPPTQARPLASVSAAAQPQRAQVMQRKLAAILSADVKGYSRLMGEDEIATIHTLTAYREVMTTLIQQHHGRVVDAPGDNLLAEFASAVDAVRGAVEIQEELQTRNAELPDHRHMQYRIGLNVGDVIVEGERIYGDGVNIAARLEALAEGGGICLSGTVYDQVETKLALKYEYLGEQTVKNIAKPVRVYRIQVDKSSSHKSSSQEAERQTATREDRAPISNPQPPVPSPQPPAPNVVGREPELMQLHRWLEKALNGERQVVFVTGEPGIGKTTLVEAFLSGIGQRGTGNGQQGSRDPIQLIPDARSPVPSLWLSQGQCIEQYGAGEAYLPVLSALGQLCRGPAGHHLVEILSQYAPTWLMQMPALLNAADLDVLQRKTQGATRERMLREMAETLEAVTAEQPLVLWLEDLHWSDASTLDLLAFLARRRQPARLLVIGTSRPVEGTDHPLRTVKQELQLHRQCEELAVGLLTEGQVAEYLAQRFGVGAHGRAPLQLAHTIHQRTEGNPLFMVNIVDELLTRETLDDTAVEISTPTTIRQLIEQQLDRLSAEEQGVLAVASVAGMEFSAAAVAAGAETTVDEIEERCVGLVRRGNFLQARGTTNWPDGTVATRYGFIHALYQEMVYERIPAGRQVRLHQQVGERLETAYGNRVKEIAAELAVHFEQARDYLRAIQYLQQAGENAVQRSAHQEAIALLTRGLELLKTLPDTPERTQQELRLQIALGTPLSIIKGYATPELEHAYTRARELCRQIGESPLLFSVLSGLCSVYRNRAELPLALELAEQLLCIAKRTQDPRQLVWAHQALGFTFHELGEFTLARTHLEEAIVLHDPKQGLHGWVADPRVGCLSYVADVLWSLGYPDQALKRNQEAVTLARELAHPYSLSFALVMASGVHWLRGERQASRETYKESASLAREQGFGDWFGLNPLLEGAEQTRQGEWVEGIARIRQGLATFRAMGKELGRPFSLSVLAEAYGRTGQVEEGVTTLEDALDLVHKAGERRYEAELYRLKGALTLQSGVQSLESRVKEAEACFLKASEVSQRQQAKSWELRAVMSLARLWQQQGKREEARQMLAEIYNWFTEGFDTADLKEAKALLNALEGQEVERQEEKDGPRRREPGKRTKKGPKPQPLAAVRPEAAAPAPDARSEQGPTLALPDKPSIAVLPFVNMSGDPGQEYFSDGITEDLITDLSKFSGLFVIARNSAFTYKGKAVKMQEVSKELGVRYVLEGSIRKAGSRVRITAQLVDATTGYHLWAERYDRELQDIFALQDEITEQIVSNLIAEGRHAELERVRRIPTENLTAYDYLLRGIEDRFRLTHEAMIQARQMFEKAIALDPQYAEAYVSLGWTYSMEWFWQWNQDPQTLERAFALAQKALALDVSLPEAHRLLGEVYLGKGQHEQASAEAEQAVALNPNDAYSYRLRAEVLTLTGKPEEALRWAEKAMRLDPRNREWYLYAVGLAYALTGQYEEAIAAFKRVVTRYPNHVGAHILLAALYSELSREEDARAAAAEVLRLSPNFSVEGMRQRATVKDLVVLDSFLAALRKAGLK